MSRSDPAGGLRVLDRPEAKPEMSDDPLISVVLPAYNEALGLAHALGVIEGIVGQCSSRYELILIDDGSRDETYQVIAGLAASNPCVRGLRFSRNFGKEAALLAGLEMARGDAVITMDTDLQHPPALIPELIDQWRRGYKVVNAVKRDRSADSALTRLRANLFNRLLTAVGGVDLQGASDFKLLDRVVVDVLVRELPERRRFFRGLSGWLGFPQAQVPFRVADRAVGDSKWSLLGLIELATTATISFTSAPLRIITLLGVMTLAFGSIVAVDALWSWFHGRSVSGFATIIVTLLIVSSSVMISLGIIGEYIAKIYEEIKARPVYLVDAACGTEEAGPAAYRRRCRSCCECPAPVADEIPDQQHRRDD